MTRFRDISLGDKAGEIFVIAICLMFLGLIKACASIGSPSDYRYRTTVYVSTPQGTKAFSAVREVAFNSDVSFPDLSPVHRAAVSGEAIPIVVGARRYFALRDETSDAPAFFAMREVASRLRGGGDVHVGMKQLTGRYDLPRVLTGGDLGRKAPYAKNIIKTWPVFVEAPSLTNPAMLRVVSPDMVRVERITIEITRDRIEPRVATLFDPVFWQEWRRFQAMTYPERERDWHGKDAPIFTIEPSTMVMEMPAALK